MHEQSALLVDVKQWMSVADAFHDCIRLTLLYIINTLQRLWALFIRQVIMMLDWIQVGLSN